MSDETKNEVKPFEPKPLKSIQEIIRDLKQDIPPQYIKTRPQSGKDIVYLTWFVVTSLMDKYAFGWSHEIRKIEKFGENAGDKVSVTVRVSIPCIEGVVYREAIGSEDGDYDKYGDTFSNAEAQALKRACAKFGLGLHLYGNPDEALRKVNEYKRNSGQTSQNQHTSNPPNNQQRQNTNQQKQNNSNQQTQSSGNASGLITEKQLSYLTKLINDSGEDFMESVLDISDQRTEFIEQLTIAEAKAGIDNLLKNK